MILNIMIHVSYFQMEDEGNHGNDEIRSFVLSNLTAHHQSRVLCVLCSNPMKVYDQYPLIDGTFFLSPVKHARGSVEVCSSELDYYQRTALEEFSENKRKQRYKKRIPIKKFNSFTI